MTEQVKSTGKGFKVGWWMYIAFCVSGLLIPWLTNQFGW